MNNKFKASLFAAAITASLIATIIALPFTARADVGTGNFLSSGTLTNGTTRTTGFSDVKVEDQEIVGLQLNMQGDGNGTGNVTVTIARSKDGSSFETTPQQVIGFALNNNTAVVGFTNLLNVGAAHTLRLISAINTNGVSATNVTISVVKKVVNTQ